MSPQHAYDIAVVGLGILGTHQITREAEATMRGCSRLFVADYAPGVVEYLRTLNPHVVDMTERFKPDVHRVQIYRTIASEVVAAAIESPPVCYASYGHPQVYSYPTILIRRAAAILDKRVKVFPGISFLDTLFVDLGLDPGVDGLQLYEATDLLVRRRPLQVDVACVVAQAPFVLQPQSNTPVDWSNVTLLQNYLSTFYPAHHELIIVVSSPHPLLKPLLRRTRIGTLAAALANTMHSGTLYIPPIRTRPIADEALADRMKRPPKTKAQSK